MPKPKNILITGGAGFLGAWIARSLSQDHLVTVIDDLSGGKKANLTEDLSDFGITLPIFKGSLNVTTCQFAEHAFAWNPPEIVVHLAANAREGASQFQPEDVTARNLMAFASTLRWAIQHRARKVVLFSSMSVYGDQGAPFSESLRPLPVDIYGWNKYAMEETLKILASVHDFDYQIIRPHNVFGPLQSLEDRFRNVAGIMMNRVMRKEPILIYGDGEQTRQFSYIEDSLPCYLSAILGSPDRRLYNIGGSAVRTIVDAADLVLSAMGELPTYPITHLPDRPLEVKHAFCDNSLAEAELGYRDAIGLRRGLLRMGAWARRQGPQAWKAESLEIPGPGMPEWWR